jgi:hypothetical protein
MSYQGINVPLSDKVANNKLAIPCNNKDARIEGQQHIRALIK